MTSALKILLVEDMESFRSAVSQLLGVYNDVDEAPDLATARSLLQKSNYDVILLDRGLPDGDGISLISEAKDRNANSVVIVLTSDSDFSSVKHAIARGADDYVTKSANIIPDLLVRIPVAVSKAASSRRLAGLEQQMKEAFRYEIVGKSASTIELRETILGMKGSNATVLISGETGTGKELVARRLNSIEDDGKRPFVAINCGAIAESIVESELFGHKKGAFTGAISDRAGKFEMAHNGDLFLDEISEMPLPAQVRLLRAIQEGEITRIGDNRTIRVECRVIAATNRDLEEMVRERKFREDLYHRLNVINIATTPLRQRREDIPDLAKLFTLQIGGASFRIDDKTTRALSDCEWPGNIRELRNCIERAVIAAKRRNSVEIRYEDVIVHRPPEDAAYRMRRLKCSLPARFSDLTPNGLRDFMGSIQKEYFEMALELCGGNAEVVANKLGLGRSTVFKKLRELGVGSKRDPILDPRRKDLDDTEINPLARGAR